MELKQHQQQNNIPRIDLRDVRFIPGTGLVRVGPEEWGSTHQGHIERLMKWIVEGHVENHNQKGA
jgi:hypothetical protein